MFACAVLYRDPQDKGVLKELHAIRQTIKDERKASGQLFKGQFGSRPEPRPQADDTAETLDAVGLRRRLVGLQERGSEGGGSQRGTAAGLGWILVYLKRVLRWVQSLVGTRKAQVSGS